MYILLFFFGPHVPLPPHTHAPVYIWCHNLGKERRRRPTNQPFPFFSAPCSKFLSCRARISHFLPSAHPIARSALACTHSLLGRTGNTKSQSWCWCALSARRVSLACLSAKETNVKAISALWRSLGAHAPARKLSVLKSIFKLGKLDVCTECVTSTV
jgi:hypothetical protein